MRFSLPLLHAAAVLATAPHCFAQNFVNFDTVGTTPTDLAGASGSFLSIEGAATTPPGRAETSYSYFAFEVQVGSGSGSGAALVGQDFLGICVNFSYASTLAGFDYALATDGSNLSYDPDPGGSAHSDQWASHRAAKYAAIRDIIATYATGLAAMDRHTLEFQERIVALNFALAEISADYDTTLASLDLNRGDMQFRNPDGSPLSLSSGVYGYYRDAIAAIGSGAGAGYTLYASGTADPGSQDLILIPLTVPEPAPPLLLGGAGVLGLLTRRRHLHA